MDKKRFLYFTKKVAPVSLVILLILVISTVMIFRAGEKLPDKRIIMFFYQTNVPSMNADAWIKEVQEDLPAIEYTEAAAYTRFVPAGASVQSGWGNFISIRLSRKEGDILLIPDERFEFLSEKGWLKPFENTNFKCDESRLIKDAEGNILGIDVSNLCFEGLDIPRSEEPHNIILPLEGERAIMCIYAGTSDPELTEAFIMNVINNSYQPIIINEEKQS